jgi:TetR/AcrR family transcriptional regulator, transcriptional repressor for nem operon
MPSAIQQRRQVNPRAHLHRPAPVTATLPTREVCCTDWYRNHEPPGETEAEMSKRGHLLQAAKRLLWERGYDATSPRDIQDASGAGQGSFYHHFDGKLDLAATALDEVSVEMRELASRLLDDSVPGLQRVARFLEQSRDGLKGCRLGRFACEASIAEPKLRTPIKQYFDHLQRLLTIALDDAQRAGQLKSAIPPADLAAMIVAVVQGGFVLSRVHRDKDAINRATSAAMELLRASASKR